jgi:tRNA G18 (ribose-2'-O)-methylase SpoU
MYNLRRIENFEDPLLAPYRTMRRQLEQRLQGIFVAEGEKVVRRLLESNLTVISVLLPEKWFKDLEPTLARRPEHIEVFVAEKALLETLTGFSMYQGLLAVGKVPAQVYLEQVLALAAKPCLLAAADGLSSAQNLGALVRNCAAFGVQALLVSETCSSPFLRRAVRSSMGTVFELPIIESASLKRELEHLRSAKVSCLAADAHTQAKTLEAADLRGDCCVVFGSEGYGISPAVLEACDERVAIPMAGKVDSLNVGSAAAVFFYEANRQRGKM